MSLQPTAKAVISTSKGDVEIDLYAKELPKLCRAFLQNCVAKKYNGLRFDTISASFIQLQRLADNSEIPRESHSRLKLGGRGCLGLLSHDDARSSSADGFFITLKPSDVQTNNVYIGEVVGESIYTAVRIADSERRPDSDEPLYPITILDTRVPKPYFEDLETARVESEEVPQKKKQKKALTIDFGDEDDEAIDIRMKSAHETLRKKSSVPHAQVPDLLDDAMLDLSDDNIDFKELEAHIYKP